MWCWRRLLRVPWTERRSNQSILKEVSPEYSFEGWMLSWNSNTLAIWCEELTHWKRPWCRERLKVGGEGDDRGWDRWMVSPTQWTWVWAGSGSWWWTGRPGVLQSMGLQRVGHDWVTELNWTYNIVHQLYFNWKKEKKSVLSSLNSLHFRINVSISILIYRRSIEIIGIAWNLQIILERTVIFMMSGLLVHEHRMSLHLLQSLISHNNFSIGS